MGQLGQETVPRVALLACYFKRRVSWGKDRVGKIDAPRIILFALIIAVKHAFDEQDGTRILVDGVRIVPNQLAMLVNLLWHLV